MKLPALFDRSPAPHTYEAAELRRAQLQALVRQTPVLMAAVLVNALALALGETHESWAARGAWLAVVAALAGTRLWSWHRNRHRPLPERVRPATIRRTIRLAFVMGAVWGVAAVGFFEDDRLGSITLLVACVAGTSAGAAVALGAVPQAALAFNAALLIPFDLQLLLSDEPTYLALGFMVFMYGAVLLLATRTVFSIFLANVLARCELARAAAVRGLLQQVAAAANQAATLAAALEASLPPLGQFLAPGHAHAVLVRDDGKAGLAVTGWFGFPRAEGADPPLAPREAQAGCQALASRRPREVQDAAGHALAAPVMAGERACALLLLCLPADGEADAGIRQALDGLTRQLALVAEREAAAAALVAAMHRAEAASQTKSRFLATMSHEIRTPLNGVIGTLDLLRETALSAEQSELVDTIGRSGAHLLHVISDILDFSKAEAGKLELERAPFDLHRLTEESAGLFLASARAKGLLLSVAIAPDVPRHVLGDATRLRQVLTNLIGNAIKFTAEGAVAVTLGPAGGRGAGEAPCLRFAIQDTGIGIDTDGQAAIFDAFTQADQSTTRRFGGTGLGLSICRQLVTLMDGRITVDSRPGAGSTFTVELPLPAAAAPAAAPAAAVQAPAPQRTGRPRVLVAEDNEINAQVATRMLARLGCDSEVAGDGEAALALWATGRFGLVLMDRQMPRLDGLAATQAIRAREAAEGRSRTPIVALTANAVAGDREACLAAGMDDYLSKPFRKADLEAVLGRWLPTPAGRAA